MLLELIVAICFCFIRTNIYAAPMDYSALGGDFLRLFLYTIIFLLLALITFYGTKFIGSNYRRIKKSRNLEILDQINISRNLTISLVRLRKTKVTYLIGSNESNIILLDKLMGEEIFDFEDLSNREDFEDVLKNIKSKFLGGDSDYDKKK